MFCCATVYSAVFGAVFDVHIVGVVWTKIIVNSKQDMFRNLIPYAWFLAAILAIYWAKYIKTNSIKQVN